jgi:hypothetical protein
MTASRPRAVAAVAKRDEHAWRGRTILACSLMAGGVVALGAAKIDWSGDPAMTLGQIIGLTAPVGILGAAIWAAAAFASRKS